MQNKEAMKDLEFEQLINESKELEKLNDLWYLVTSATGAKVAGSGDPTHK